MSEYPAGEQPSQSQNPHQGEDAYEKTRPLSDSLPEYTKLYQNQQQPAPRQQDYHQSAPQQYYQQPAPQPYYQQPVYVQPVPMMTVVPKTPQQIAGEQAAQTSLALGIVGLVLALFWVTSVIPLGLGIWGAVKGAQASRVGVPAGGGLATSWIALSLGAIETLFFFIPMVAFMIAAIASTR